MEGEAGVRTPCPDPAMLPRQVQTQPETLQIRIGRSHQHRPGNALPTGGHGQATLLPHPPTRVTFNAEREDGAG